VEGRLEEPRQHFGRLAADPGGRERVEFGRLGVDRDDRGARPARLGGQAR
jgi:hypothetical protein